MVSMKENEKLEKKETPAFEAKEHSPKFLKKAAHMADKKLGGKKSGKTTSKRHGMAKTA